MKKTLTILILLLSLMSNSQESTRKEVTSAPMLICSNEERTKWFAIIPTFNKFDGIILESYLKTMKSNIGECSKEDVLMFIFTDGKKMKISANNEKNCDGLVELIFPLTSIDVAFLETKKLESIRYINGNDLSSFVYVLSKEDKNYFISTLSTYKK
jgi:hypothetical protein